MQFSPAIKLFIVYSYLFANEYKKEIYQLILCSLVTFPFIIIFIFFGNPIIIESLFSIIKNNLKSKFEIKVLKSLIPEYLLKMTSLIS